MPSRFRTAVWTPIRSAKERESSPTESPVANFPTLETVYGYDALNNLVSVNQKGTSSETPRIRVFVYDSLSRLTSSTNPETGTIGYGYGANGNMTSKTDARGVTTSYIYDALNRLTSKRSAGASGVPGFNYGYAYDGSGVTFSPSNAIGRLVESSNSETLPNNLATMRTYTCGTATSCCARSIHSSEKHKNRSFIDIICSVSEMSSGLRTCAMEIALEEVLRNAFHQTEFSDVARLDALHSAFLKSDDQCPIESIMRSVGQPPNSTIWMSSILLLLSPGCANAPETQIALTDRKELMITTNQGASADIRFLPVVFVHLRMTMQIPSHLSLCSPGGGSSFRDTAPIFWESRWKRV
jgi:YD repeat-containing protein